MEPKRPLLPGDSDTSGCVTYRQARFTLAMLLVAYVFSLVDRQILSLLVMPIRQSLGISDFQMSLLQGMAFALFYALFGIPIGRLADRFNRRIIITCGIFLWSCMTVGCGLAQSFAMLFIARVGVAVGEATLSPSAYSLLSDTFTPARLPRAIAIYTTGSTIGSGLAYIIGGSALAAVSGAEAFNVPFLGTMEPWQIAFVIVGLPGLLVAAAMLFVVEPPRHGVAPGSSSAAMPWSEVLGYMRQHRRAYGAIFTGISCLATVGYGYLNWYPTFLIRTYGMLPHHVGLIFGTLFLVFGTLGAYGSARFSEYLAARGFTDSTLRTPMFAALGLIPMAVGTLMPNAVLALIVSAPTFVLMNSYYGVGFAALQLITPNRMRGVVSAMLLLLSSLVGLGVGASLVAALTDFVFRDDLALRYSLSVLTGVGAPVAAFALWTGLAPYRAALQERGRGAVNRTLTDGREQCRVS